MAEQKRRLGDLLLDSGLISQEQLDRALEKQRASGERLGKVLVQLGYVTDHDIIQVLEYQLGIPHVSLSNYQVDPEVVRSIPQSIAKRHQVLPLQRRDRSLVLAMVDPLNVLAIDEVRLLTEMEVEPVIATEEEISNAIGWYFGVREQVDRVLHSMQDQAPAEEQQQPAATAAPGVEELREIVEEAPVVQAVNSLILQAIRERASDIHLEVMGQNVRVRYRVDGTLREILNLPHYTYAPILTRIKIMAGMDIAEKRLPQDGRTEMQMGDRQVDMRVSSLPTVSGEKIVLRLLEKESALMDLDQLGYSSENLERFRRMVHRPYGIVLVTGPTGSGKTTTLYAALQELDASSMNIVTVEDPVEYQLEGINQVQLNYRAGLTFATGLRSILRQDPNVIMVGEIRDTETADIAVRAALTGHLVFATLHTNEAAGAVSRLIDMGVEPYLLSSAMIGAAAQRLVRRVCPRCAEQREVPPGAPERMTLGVSDEEPLTLTEGAGCPYCARTGFRGRMALHEVLEMDNRLRQMILEKASTDEIREAARQAGMTSLQDDGFNKALGGYTTLNEVVRVSY